jgi:peptidoglycan/LPS O-acetylase OafA/YrhL
MQLGSNKIIAGAKYIYLIAFFALLSGVFYPVITHSVWDPVIIGTLILFLGLAGTVLLFKAGTSAKNKKICLIAGLVIMAVALFLVYLAIGRV